MDLTECEWPDLSNKSDEEIVRELRFLAERARHNEFQLLHHMGEFDDRKLCVGEHYRSLYEYCTLSLGFDENEAFRRIKAARVLKKYPVARKSLEKGCLTVSSLAISCSTRRVSQVAATSISTLP